MMEQLWQIILGMTVMRPQANLRWQVKYFPRLVRFCLKFIYSKKATKFCKISTVGLHRRFRKNLWPSQNIWTLLWIRIILDPCCTNQFHLLWSILFFSFYEIDFRFALFTWPTTYILHNAQWGETISNEHSYYLASTFYTIFSGKKIMLQYYVTYE